MLAFENVEIFLQVSDPVEQLCLVLVDKHQGPYNEEPYDAHDSGDDSLEGEHHKLFWHRCNCLRLTDTLTKAHGGCA